jgi:ABC-type nitrate/sulfonate/bicarbonate transport system substrate-binding protein
MRLRKMRLLAAFILVSVSAAAQEGYKIKLTLKPYTNSLIYLAYYYGKLKAVADSAVLDANSTTTFQGKEKLPGGIYFIVSPKK